MEEKVNDMLLIRPYMREHAVEYAKAWAFSQNPLFGDFDAIGGNCTNFASQCLYAGSCRMNYLPVFGWYYISIDERAPAWTGVEYFYNFLVSNRGEGPFGREGTPDEIEVGDMIQLGRTGEGFYHTLVIVGFEEEEPLVAAQSDDAYDRPLSSYTYDFLRYIKILGVRVRTPSVSDCFDGVIEGTSLMPENGSNEPDGNESDGNEPNGNESDGNGLTPPPMFP